VSEAHERRPVYPAANARESFSDMPDERHAVSENASKTAPAKLLAVFVVDPDEKVLTMPYEK
jgi:hypothetical protein